MRGQSPKSLSKKHRFPCIAENRNAAGTFLICVRIQEQEGQDAEDLRQEPPPCMITGPKSRAGRRRLARGAFSGQFSHDQAEVEREDAAQVAFVVIDPAAQGGAPQAAAVENVGKAPPDLFAALFEQGFAAFAFHGAGVFWPRPAGLRAQGSRAGGVRRWGRR